MTDEILDTMNAILIPASNQQVAGQFVAIEQSIQTNANTLLAAGCSGSCNGSCSVV